MIAHRSGNALDRVADAERAGAAWIEADLWLHRGRIEVRHEKTAGPLPVLWDRWSLHNPFAPRLELDALLAALPGHDVTLMLDLKGRDPRLAQLVRAAIDARPELGTVVVCARHWPLLELFEGDPRYRVMRSVGSRRGLQRLLARPAAAPRGAVSIHADLLDAATVQQLRAACDQVVSWPVNDLERAATLAGWGVHGLISDEPAAIAPVTLEPAAEVA